MNRHLGNTYITINQHLGDQNINKSTFMQHMTINRHLGTKITINQHLRQPFSSHTPMNRHLGNTYITINRHLGDQNNNKSTFMQQNNNKSTFRRPK